MTDKRIASIRKNAREEIRVELTTYNGRRLCNVRVWFEADDGSYRPSKAGVTMRADLLKEFADAAQSALQEYEAEGGAT